MPKGIYDHKKNYKLTPKRLKVLLGAGFKKGNKLGNLHKGKPRPYAKELPQVFKKGEHRNLNTEFKKGQKPWNTGLKGFRSGSKNNMWKDGRTLQKGYFSHRVKIRRARAKGSGGSHTLGEWETLKAQYGFTCPCCKKSEPIIILTQDHIIPITRGGTHNIENIQPLCRSCNSKKHLQIIKYVQ